MMTVGLTHGGTAIEELANQLELPVIHHVRASTKTAPVYRLRRRQAPRTVHRHCAAALVPRGRGRAADSHADINRCALDSASMRVTETSLSPRR